MPRPGRPRLLAITLGTVLGLVALEAVMQIGAFVLERGVRSRRSAESASEGPGDATVLCVGDSFTFGLGATAPEHSYPRALARRLEQAQPGHWRVVERARPGRSSGEVLQRLGTQLASYRPRVVFLLAGYNDTNSVAAEVERPDASTGPADKGFVWRWRSLALLRRIGDALFGEQTAAAVAGADALLGTWHGGGAEITVYADGRVTFGAVESRWRLVGDELRYGAVEADESAVAWRIDGAQLTLRGAHLPGGELRLEHGPAPAARARDAAEADPAAVRAELALRRGDVDRGLGAALTILDATPQRHGALWRSVLELVQRRPEIAAEVLVVVASAAPRVAGDVDLEPLLLAAQAVLTEQTGGAPADALAAALRCGLVYARSRAAESGRGSFGAALRMLDQRERYDDATVAAARAQLSLTPAEAATIDRIIESARVPAASVEERYRRHLLRIHAACRGAGATLCLLTYPEAIGSLESILRRFALDHGVALLDLQPVFAEALARQPRAALFVPDGHCSDGGYALIADQVAGWLRDR